MPSRAPVPDVGRRLAAARLRRGLSQGTVARLSRVAASYLSRIETGKVHPTFRTVLRIATVLRVSAAEIVGPDVTRAAGIPTCPVSETGQCLLELMRPGSFGESTPTEERYTLEEIRLLQRLAAWMRRVSPDRRQAMEILLEDLTSGSPDGEPGKADQE